MSKSERYLENRTEAFRLRGLDPSDKRYNCHHIKTKEDKKRGLLPPGFDIDAVENLLPILIERHEDLNHYMVTHPEVHNDISTRENLAHLAEIGELDHYAPIKTRAEKHKTKKRKHHR